MKPVLVLSDLHLSATRPAAVDAFHAFARVVAGTDVVDKVKGVATANAGMHQNVPCDDVVITRAEEVPA